MIYVISHDELSLTREPAEAFFEESGLAGALNFDHFCQTWGGLIRLDIACIMLYLDAQESIKGIIGGTCTPCTMTAETIAQESFWWVHPTIRSQPAGIRLLQAWEGWARSKGAKRIYVGNLFRLNDEKMRNLYAKLGYQPLEVHYVK